MKRIATIAAAVLLFTACDNTTPTENKQDNTATPVSNSTESDTTDIQTVVDTIAQVSNTEDAVSTGKVEGAESYIKKMNKTGVPCFIDPKDNSLHIELMESINGDYNELASYTLREAISSGVKGISRCKVYLDRELVGEAWLEEKK